MWQDHLRILRRYAGPRPITIRGEQCSKCKGLRRLRDLVGHERHVPVWTSVRRRSSGQCEHRRRRKLRCAVCRPVCSCSPLPTSPNDSRWNRAFICNSGQFETVRLFGEPWWDQGLMRSAARQRLCVLLIQEQPELLLLDRSKAIIESHDIHIRRRCLPLHAVDTLLKPLLRDRLHQHAADAFVPCSWV